MNKILLAILAFIALTMVGYGGTHVLSTLTAKPHTAQANGQIQQATAPAPTKYEVGPPDAQELLELVNAERAKVGVAPLKIDERLNQSAQWKADDMVTYDYFGHIKPGESRNNGLDYLDSIDDSLCRNVGENITDNTESADNYSLMSFTSWKNSASHYKAMINPAYAYTGFGISGTKVVEHFCIAR